MAKKIEKIVIEATASGFTMKLHVDGEAEPLEHGMNKIGPGHYRGTVKGGYEEVFKGFPNLVDELCMMSCTSGLCSAIEKDNKRKK